MKKVTLIVTFIALSLVGFAQDEDAKTLSFSIGAEGSYPIGDFKDFYSFGIGGSVQGDYLVAPSFALTLNAGYISYAGEDYKITTQTGIDINGNPTFGTVTVDGKKLGLLPVMAGGKYWFSPMFYGHGQLGVTFVNDGGGSNFSYAPGIGVKFSAVDISAKYFAMSSKGNSNFSAIGLRVAYNF